MKAIASVIEDNKQNIKDVKDGKKMYIKEALDKFKYEICGLLSVPPDVCLTEEQWKQIIEQTKRLFNR